MNLKLKILALWLSSGSKNIYNISIFQDYFTSSLSPPRASHGYTLPNKWQFSHETMKAPSNQIKDLKRRTIVLVVGI